MVGAVVLYGPPEDPDAFERYYADTHTAPATAIPGLQRFEAAQGIATPDGSAAPYQRIAELTYAGVESRIALTVPMTVREGARGFLGVGLVIECFLPFGWYGSPGRSAMKRSDTGGRGGCDRGFAR